MVSEAEIAAHHTLPAPTNERFRSYVQSTAFSLQLGRTHISAFTLIESGLVNGYEINRWPVNDSAIAGLVRRGLVLDLQPEVRTKCRFTGDDVVLWSDHYAITTAGKLVLELLTEAGLIPPRIRRLPPPPPAPGWVDPRPKLVL